MSDYHRQRVHSGRRREKISDMPLALKHLDESGVFAGYASVFDVVDSQKDIIRKGAFLASIQRGARDVKLLWQHHMHEPIGVIEQLREDEQGLYLKGRLMLDVERAREAYSLLKQGVVRGLSIGYSPKKWRVDPDSGIRVIEQVDLWEVSLVTFPANEAAQITVVKQRDDMSMHVRGAMAQVMQSLDALLSSTR